MEKLRGSFLRRGVAVTSVALLAALQSASAAALPADLNATVISGIAIKGAAGAAPLALLAKATLEFMKWTKIKIITASPIALLLAAGTGSYAWKNLHQPSVKSEASAPSGANTNTDWFHEARYGVLMHFLPEGPRNFPVVDRLDVNHLANQLEAIGAKYLVFTLGQYSGYYNTPNATLDKLVGYAP